MSIDPDIDELFEFVIEEPNTQKVMDKRRKRERDEAERKERDALAKKMQEQKQEAQKKQMQELEKKAEAHKKELQMRQDKEKVEIEKLETLSLKERKLLNNIQLQKTGPYVSGQGYALNDPPIQVSHIADFLRSDNVIEALHLDRQTIDDEHGCFLAESLKENRHMLQMSLEGNNLGAKSAYNFGEMIKENRTLKVLDLSNNCLKGKADLKGFNNLCDSLKYNDTLLCLNLSGNGIDDKGGKTLLEGLKQNKSLIQLDFSFNDICDQKLIGEIRDILANNYKNYSEERLDEQKERKRMGRELELTRMHIATKETEKMVQEEIKRGYDHRHVDKTDAFGKKCESDIELWKKHIEKTAEEYERHMAASKGGKKKKKGKK